MVSALPAELVEAVKAVFGGVGLMILFAGWGLYRHLMQRTLDRRGRLERGLTVLDESRDREIKRLNDEIEAIRERAAEDLARCERATARKQAEIEQLIRERDRGWDLVRELDERLHTMRHAANNRIMEAWQRGHLNEPMPEPLPKIPPVSEMTGKRPPAGE